MKTGELVKLAKWCKNGSSLMQIIEIKHDFIKAMFLTGPKTGKTSEVFKGNLFSLDDYDGAMEKHDISRRSGSAF